MKTRICFGYLLVLTLVFLSFGSCDGPAEPNYDFTVATLNMLRPPNDESPEQTMQRYRFAHRELTHVPGFGGFSFFMGLQELPYTEEQTLLGPITLIRANLPCSEERVAVRCFAGLVDVTDSDSPNVEQWGENGYIVGYPWEIVPGSGRAAFIGEEVYDVIKRHVVGARFRNKFTGVIVPFYTVHISNTDDIDRLNSEITGLINKLKSYQVAGDLTPVLVGDFNCHHWSSRHRVKMNAAFFNAVSDLNVIDLVWIGRPEAFPTAGGVAMPVEQTATRSSTLVPNEFSDHEMTLVTLRFDPGTTPTIPAPPEPTSGKGCK